jgi:hypothetical protein
MSPFCTSLLKLQPRNENHGYTKLFRSCYCSVITLVPLLQRKEPIKVKLNINIKIKYHAGDFSVNTTQISNLTKQEHNKSCAYEIIITSYIKKL